MDSPNAAAVAREPITKLKITEPLASFPPEILQHATSLVQLDLSGTGLSSLPDEFSSFTSLKVLFLSSCRFTEFPAVLSRCPSLEMVAFRGNGMRSVPEDSLPPRLRWLILTGNEIEALPRSIGKCARLQKCMLSGNRLAGLPEEMMKCTKLGLLRLSANQIQELPGWLYEMPELAFLSIAGNPCTGGELVESEVAQVGEKGDMEEEEGLLKIPWTSLSVHSLLGEGASGIISKGTFTLPNGSTQDAAVKIFKGSVTSDGTPMDEMRACMRAACHPNLIDTQGRITDHPDGPDKKGLVMELIPPTYRTLGLPPSLDSCTRDCFAPDTSMTMAQGAGILHGIASAARHLHAKGVAHGDLYAHNILYDEGGHAILGDLGAASIYHHTDTVTERRAHERLEVLALAHLMEDIWTLVKSGLSFSAAELSAAVLLERLHKRCAVRQVASRPGLDDITDELRKIRELAEGREGGALDVFGQLPN
ncbi:serine/threonine protein kinase [Apiospora kogelbergensis]|uniref:serine/threonine protein kinase n=1 Tax=Apiospora kogelbergensis TaxID=1337665 RepID=UPI00313071F9